MSIGANSRDPYFSPTVELLLDFNPTIAQSRLSRETYEQQTMPPKGKAAAKPKETSG